jgi:hypothetical protein
MRAVDKQINVGDIFYNKNRNFYILVVQIIESEDFYNVVYLHRPDEHLVFSLKTFERSYNKVS